jgi:hypothetical protein
MEPSPLTQDSRPEVFQPKIIRLYEALFKVRLEAHTGRSLTGRNAASPGTLATACEARRATREAGQTARRRDCARGTNDDDNTAVAATPCDSRLTGQTLTVFLDAALAKKYTNPSSDVISVLAGLHDADTVMTEMVATLDTVMRSGRSSRYRTGMWLPQALC